LAPMPELDQTLDRLREMAQGYSRLFRARPIAG
jgi:hypothetical protein